MNKNIIFKLHLVCANWEKSEKSVPWLVRQKGGHLSALEGPGPWQTWPNYCEMIEMAWWGSDPVEHILQNIKEVERIVNDLEERLRELLKSSTTNIMANPSPMELED
jgi:hypothetical protein